MRRLPVILVIAVLLGLNCGCREERQSFVPNVGGLVPTMTTLDVSTFISDSGYTRYHIVAPLWQMFEDATEPFWKFPQGLELEQYNEQMRPNGNMVCDSATYFSRQRLWRLDGHVVMVNTVRDSFLTQQLFWDQTKQEVYSDSFIHIVRQDRIIEGYGFTSNQNMTSYTVNRPTGIFPVNRPQQTSANPDTLAIDTNSVVSEPQGRRHTPLRKSQQNISSINPQP